MANHLQSKKRIRQSAKRKARNGSLKSWTRKSIIQLRAAIDAGDLAPAEEALKVAVKNLDKSVTKNVMKKKTASRTISRLTLAVNKLR
ncbi:MAG: 30S ribosomal protein S20 [Deltaproteobacteria bacterium]|nr:30S ribosomal protein S20 [Deltaproteobacteria bacterium]MBN2674285.1 30S ribosomal protein S20 [Deltaproteobacteria bacterium]